MKLFQIERRAASALDGLKSSCMLSKAAERLETELEESTGPRTHSPHRTRLAAAGIPDTDYLSDDTVRALSPSIWYITSNI